jgi:hypothetical protein
MTHAELALVVLQRDLSRTWNTGEISAGMGANVPPSAARNACLTLVQEGRAIRHPDGTFQACDVLERVRDLVLHSGLCWTPHGVATELPDLHLTEQDAARVLTLLLLREEIELWAESPNCEVQA